MYKIVISLCCAFVIMGFLTMAGCFDTTKTNVDAINYQMSKVTYSYNRTFATISAEDIYNISSLFEQLYEKGYVYIGDVQQAWNLAGKKEQFLVFKLKEVTTLDELIDFVGN